MARKFNIGRQGEQLLNDEFHNLFMSLKYLNYDRYKGIENFYPERQTEIPDHALRVRSRENLDLLQAYYPNGENGIWKNVFEGHYHPASAVRPLTDDPTILAPYQLCIDPKTGAIMYWDASTNSWMVARANEYLGELDSFNGMNYQFITPLKKATEIYVRYEPVVDDDGKPVLDEKGNQKLDKVIDEIEMSPSFYPVPFIPYGRLFTGTDFEEDFIGKNQCAINTDATDLSWVHVNASKLVRVDKRLIEVQQDANIIDYGFISVTSNQTEFYGFGYYDGEDYISNKGKLLRRDIDFIDVVGGIQLLNVGQYKYVHSVTYTFDESPSNEGLLLKDTKRVGGKNEVYIGQLRDDIALFMDGLSLEQSDENDNDIYIHNKTDGTIVFIDDDDADIINEMQMTTLLFPRRSNEFSITSTGANVSSKCEDVIISSINELDTIEDPFEGMHVYVELTKENLIIKELEVRTYEDEYGQTIPYTKIVDYEIIDYRYTVDVKTGNNIEGWQTPMVFCSGLGLQETEIFEDVIVHGGTVTIKNLVLPGDEMIKGFVADVGDSFICKGVLNKPEIVHKDIKSDTRYVVFVNGILLTPTNRDMTVEDGRILINNSEDVEFDNLDYVVFEIDDANDKKIALVFDETVSYFSVRIDDGGDPTAYNDCNSSLVYIEGSLLLDQAAIEKPINTIEGYYKGGQIIRVTDDYGNYQYYQYDYTAEEPTLLDEYKGKEIDLMVGYYATGGSIHLLGNNEAFEGSNMTYYAYNYANMIDEVAIIGSKNDLVINIGSGNDEYHGAAGRLNAWQAGNESVSAYINGLIIESEEEDISENMTRKYVITYPKLDAKPDEQYYGERDLLAALDSLYNIYKTKFDDYKSKEEYSNAPDRQLKDKIFDEDISSWELNRFETAKDYFYTESLSKEALELAIYFNEDMQKEHTSYVIEKVERGEFVAANRDYIYLETNIISDHGQIYRAAQDTVEVDFTLAPGTTHVYLNGVLLPYEDYCKFDNNKIMFNLDVCGLQQLPRPENMALALPEHLSDYDRKYYETIYGNAIGRKRVLRLIKDKMYYVPTSSRDTILIEKRADTSIKSVTYDVLSISYSSLEFTQDYYDIPDSLMNTADHIKIYINGVYYDGGYALSRAGGIKGIKLTDPNALKMDPIYEYFSAHPQDAQKYFETTGQKYERAIDKITFEWR